MAYRGLPPMERFLKYVDKSGGVPEARPDLGECWLWKGAIQNGYGVFSLTPEPGVHVSVKAHRWYYQQAVGPVEQTLDHLCRVRHCVNPSHLEECSQGENNARSAGFRKRRTHCPRGHSYEDHGRIYNGYPICRVCNTIKAREYRKRKREQNG